MIETILHPRITENEDWATTLFVLSFAIIAITKSIFENRFGDFANLIFSNKYTKVYKDNSNLKSGFTIALFLVQVISLAFFIQISLSYFGYASKTDWVLYIQIFTFLIFFIFSSDTLPQSTFSHTAFQPSSPLLQLLFESTSPILLHPSLNTSLFPLILLKNCGAFILSPAR